MAAPKKKTKKKERGHEDCHERRKRDFRYHPDGSGLLAGIRDDYLSEIGGFPEHGIYYAEIEGWEVEVRPDPYEERVFFILTSPDGRVLRGRRRCMEEGLTVLEWLEGQHMMGEFESLMEMYAR